MSKNHKVAPEIKEQILQRIKNDGVSIKQAATEHGLSDRTIYGWLGKQADGGPSNAEIIKLRRENQELLTLLGEVTVKLSAAQKKK
ncbi:MAG: transposase [Patescibacteria group bacterium]